MQSEAPPTDVGWIFCDTVDADVTAATSGAQID